MVYGTASLGDLFDPRYVGAVTVRPHSALAAMGQYEVAWQAAAPVRGELPDLDVMRQNWDIILAEAIRAKANIAQFWKSENEAQAAFRTNGCWSFGHCSGLDGLQPAERWPAVQLHLHPRKGRLLGCRATCS